MNRIDEKLAELARNGRGGLFPFLAAGQGGLETTVNLILRFQQLGACGIELGFPFSDPVADGPVICGAFSTALEAGTTVRGVFDTVEQAKDQITIPMIAMVSVSIVYRVGITAFLDRARQVGFDGIIIPDLSLEEAPAVAEEVAKRDLKFVMLLAPTSSLERQQRIAKTATGFLYYMSVAGITGERDTLPPELAGNVRKLKELSAMPVLVGFGISSGEQVRSVCSVADGAIVGSAFVRRIAELLDSGADGDVIVDRAGQYLTELLSGLDPSG